MGIKKTARNAGALRDPAIEVPDLGEGSVNALIDAGQEPDHVPLHNLGPAGKRKCKADDNGAGCALCDAEVPLRHNWTVRLDKITDDGETVPRTLWLSRQDLGRLGSVLPDAGSCEIEITRIKDEKAKTKRNDGTDWTVFDFAVRADD